jgi:hypothetical protein
MDHRDEFHVVKMCQIFGVSHSSYYAWLKRPNSSQKNRKERLIKIATRMTKELVIQALQRALAQETIAEGKAFTIAIEGVNMLLMSIKKS